MPYCSRAEYDYERSYSTVSRSVLYPERTASPPVCVDTGDYFLPKQHRPAGLVCVNDAGIEVGAPENDECGMNNGLF